MNITEAIALNERHGKNRMPIAEAKQFWATEQEKAYGDDAIIGKTFDGIKLVESLVRKDAERKYFQPDRLQLIFRTQVHPKAEGKKNASSTLWIDLISLDSPELMYSMTYCHGITGKSVVYDGTGKVLVEGKGWKKIRSHFQTFKEDEAPKETSKVKKAAKAPSPAVEEIPVPEIPSELA